LPAEHLDGCRAGGPEVGDILGDHHVPEELLAHFNRRAGYLRSADPVFTDELDVFIEADLRGASQQLSPTR
jgi:hypothetical protein